MRQVMMVVMAVGLLFIATKVAAAEECVIDGYLPEQFFVKGIVEEKTKRCISQLQQSLAVEDGRPVISVIGSADKSGHSHDNYLLAKSRAEQVGAMVSASFPDAVVKSLSAGDGENLRQVKVVFIREAPAPHTTEVPGSNQQEQPKKSEETVSKNYPVFILGGIVLLIVMIAFVLYKMPNRQTRLKEKEDEVRQQEVVTEIITIGEYEVPIKIHEGFHWSPFVSANGNDIKRKSFSDIKQSIVRCLKDPQFADQRDRLIEEGIIKIGAR